MRIDPSSWAEMGKRSRTARAVISSRNWSNWCEKVIHLANTAEDMVTWRVAMAWIVRMMQFTGIPKGGYIKKERRP